MRWKIDKNRRRIASENFEGHCDDIEMSGEQVSGVIAYGVQDGETYYKRRFAFPNIRIQPNDTHGTYQTESSESPISFAEKEIFERVEWDGVLSVYAHAGELKVIRRFFPSATLPVFYERVELYNGGTCALAPEWAMCDACKVNSLAKDTSISTVSALCLAARSRRERALFCFLVTVPVLQTRKFRKRATRCRSGVCERKN